MANPTETGAPVVFEINGRYFKYENGQEVQVDPEPVSSPKDTEEIKAAITAADENVPTQPEEETEDDSDPHSEDEYSKMSVDDLKQIAKDREVDLTGVKRKSELIARLREAEEA